MAEQIDLVKAVLQAMVSRKLWKSNHLKREKVVRSGFPSHLRGAVDDTISKLIKKGYIKYYDKGRNAIQLNFEFKEEILKIICDET